MLNLFGVEPDAALSAGTTLGTNAATGVEAGLSAAFGEGGTAQTMWATGWVTMSDVVDTEALSMSDSIGSVEADVVSLANKIGSVKTAIADLQAMDMPGIYLGGINPPTGGMATGGSILAGATHLVGENGPELFTPSRSGFILPNSAMRGGMSGGDSGATTVNIYGVQNVDALLYEMKRRGLGSL